MNEGTCNSAVFDLVMTSEPDMIDVVSVLGRFGSSDHNILQWDVKLNPVFSLFNRSCLNYVNADFVAIRQALKATNWSSVGYYRVMPMSSGNPSTKS